MAHLKVIKYAINDVSLWLQLNRYTKKTSRLLFRWQTTSVGLRFFLCVFRFCLIPINQLSNQLALKRNVSHHRQPKIEQFNVNLAINDWNFSSNLVERKRGEKQYKTKVTMCIKHCNQITSFNVYTQISDFWIQLVHANTKIIAATTLNAHEIAAKERKTLSKKRNGEW